MREKTQQTVLIVDVDHPHEVAEAFARALAQLHRHPFRLADDVPGVALVVRIGDDRVRLEADPAQVRAFIREQIDQPLADMQGEPHADDERLRLERTSRLRVQLGKEWDRAFVTLDGEPLPKVRGFAVWNHMRDDLSGMATRVRVVCIAEPVRPRSDYLDAVHRYVDADGMQLEQLNGIVVDEQEWREFIAWKRGARGRGAD